MASAAWQTVVRNTSGAAAYFGYLPKHGTRLAANQTFTFDGDLKTFLQSDKRRYDAFTKDVDTGRLTIDATGSGGVGAGAKGANVSQVGESGADPIHKTTLTFVNKAIATTDAGASGAYAAVELYTFPQGAVNIQAVVTNLTVVAAAGIVATATLKHSVGVAAEAANDVLDATQANLLASTNTVLVGSAGAPKGLGTTAVIIDGTTTPAKAFLNFGIVDAGSTANSTLTLNGTVTISWTFFGDN